MKRLPLPQSRKQRQIILSGKAIAYILPLLFFLFSCKKVDKWVATAAQHPFVQGTTEPEFDEAFSRLLRKDPEVLAVMTSRQLIGSHDAAVAAAAKLKRSGDAQLAAGRIEVVDTTVTDVGAGLVTLAVVQWRKAGLPLEKVAEACRAFVKGGRSIVTDVGE